MPTMREPAKATPAPIPAETAPRARASAARTSTSAPRACAWSATLPEQIAEAIDDQAVPISRLLRLMWALDAAQSPADEGLRARLRARIGAPLTV